MTILEKITAYKKKEVEVAKAKYPIKLLEESIYFNNDIVSMKSFLRREDSSGIIAEFKRKSPSKGFINQYASVEEVSIGYMQAGASAISVLTDTHFFGGKYEDLTTARNFNYAPILNKNFIIDEYQIITAKSIGADVILLIAACLTHDEIISFSKVAKSLGLEVLLEIHNEDEISKICPDIDFIGVNNRNLKTFEVDIQNSLNLVSRIPDDFIKISESGLNNVQDIYMLKDYGYKGFLIGERFMKESYPHISCRNFIQKINSTQQKTIAYEN